MKKKEKKLKKLLDFLVYAFVLGAQFIFQRLSRKKAMAASCAIGNLLYHLVKSPRKAIEENLKFIYSSALTDEKINRMTRDIFVCQVKNQVELFIYRPEREKGLAELVIVENIHELDNALKENNGVLLLTAHLGDWILGITRLISMGHNIYGIIRPFSNKPLYRFLEKVAASRNIHLIPRGEKSKNSYTKLLSENKILTTAIDQHALQKGITIPFMGKPAQTACGWVVLAKKTNARVLVAFCIRKHDDKYRLVIENPGALVFTGNDEKDLYENTLKVNKIIESYIYQYPEQWYWMHKRWRTVNAA